MSREFLDTSSLEDALSVIRQHIPLGTSSETLPLLSTPGRNISSDLISPEDLPSFSKSTVDGYAVKSANTFGASEGTPIYLEVIGEVLMGSGAIHNIHREGINDSGNPVRMSENTAIRIPTGGMIPEGADGVVMVEYTQICKKDQDREYMIEVTRAVAPGENIIRMGEDIRKGDLLFPEGHQLRTQDIGILAGLGIDRVPVFRQPRVAILSTGPEICPIDQRPAKGQVRDINAYTLGSLVRESGGEPIHMGICPDDLRKLKEMIQTGLKKADCVLISGGSSVGARDFTFQAITELGPPGVLIHGLSIRPGKPTIVGQSGIAPIIGLPGHPASAMVVAQAIVQPLIWRLAGLKLSPLETRVRKSSRTVRARLTRNISSPPGKEDFVRIALTTDQKGGNILRADPIFGKSGLISTLIKAHGILRISEDSEGAYEGDEVEIWLF
jgi:molybdopterin molybdotransferase